MSFLRTVTGWAAAVHVANLDAPVVAVAWQDALARLTGVWVTPAERIVLFLSVWLAYAADRGLDVAWRPAVRIRTERHRLVRRHVAAFVALWAIVFVVAVCVSVRELDAQALRSGWWLFGLVLAYLGVVQGVARAAIHGFPKEVAVAGLFATGTAWFVGVRVLATNGGASIMRLVAAAFAFALLALLNCLLISRVEYREDRARGEIAWLSRRTLRRVVSGGTLLIATLALVVALVGLGASTRIAEFAFLVAASSAALYVLDRAVRKVEMPRHAVGFGRAWADICLWTPLPFVIVRVLGG